VNWKVYERKISLFGLRDFLENLENFRMNGHTEV